MLAKWKFDTHCIKSSFVFGFTVKIVGFSTDYLYFDVLKNQWYFRFQKWLSLNCPVTPMLCGLSGDM